MIKPELVFITRHNANKKLANSDKKNAKKLSFLILGYHSALADDTTLFKAVLEENKLIKLNGY